MYTHEEGKAYSVHITWERFPIEGETVYRVISEDVDNINKYGFMTAKELTSFLNAFCFCNSSTEAYQTARLEILSERYRTQGMSMEDACFKAIREVRNEDEHDKENDAFRHAILTQL